MAAGAADLPLLIISASLISALSARSGITVATAKHARLTPRHAHRFSFVHCYAPSSGVALGIKYEPGACEPRCSSLIRSG